MPVVNCDTGEVREHTTEELAAIAVEIEAAAAAVPAAVSPAQMKLAMFNAGLLDEVDAFVATQPRDVQIRWEYSTQFDRGHPMLNAAAASFGMSTEQVDDLFRSAASL